MVSGQAVLRGIFRGIGRLGLSSSGYRKDCVYQWLETRSRLKLDWL